MRVLGLDEVHFKNNFEHFRRDNLTPQKVLDAQKLVWADLGVTGAQQKTRPENFLVIGQPFEHGGEFYSKIFNEEALGPHYAVPTLKALHNRDESANVKQKVVPEVPLAWWHSGDDEEAVKNWYRGIAAEAKDGRVLFNLHWPDAWAALFHEPVHEAAPDGGIGSAPRWTFEGYCEIFAALLAAKLGVSYDKYKHPDYIPYATEVKKMIDFTSPSCVAKAYFLNDAESLGRLCPLFWSRVAGYEIAPAIPEKYVLGGTAAEVPQFATEQIKSVVQRNQKPEWYKRWVRLYGRSDQMPTVPTPPPMNIPVMGDLGGQPVIPTPPPMGGHGGQPVIPTPPPMGGLGGSPPMVRGARGGPAPRGGPALGGLGGGMAQPQPAVLTGKLPPTDWV